MTFFLLKALTYCRTQTDPNGSNGTRQYLQRTEVQDFLEHLSFISDHNNAHETALGPLCSPCIFCGVSVHLRASHRRAELPPPPVQDPPVLVPPPCSPCAIVGCFIDPPPPPLIWLCSAAAGTRTDAQPGLEPQTSPCVRKLLWNRQEPEHSSI